MLPDDKKYIEELEAKYDQFKPKLDQLQTSLEVMQAAYQDYIDLRNFYASPKWFDMQEQDYQDVKCGILSQDQLYDLIGQHNHILGELLALSSQMYKHL
ncbi:DUF4298 domain-containing protein [Streptococcus ictaluri]|uniref:DUF4298 domain-containing protein n=1 Tax=Streptococcus ictaluri 707-05 TaxID=764299 RepID=G5K1I2_9STRE|nr:DUF4298 domain-containing protein [Streptococcus ictaluri]EHI70164.1 hypothetical protein STRIC_2240 [Streptococcus ictaluri 707-05]